MNPDPTTPAGPRPTRVLVADDGAGARATLRDVLAGVPDVEVLAEAGDGAQCLRRCAALAPDVVLVGLTGDDATDLVRRLGPLAPGVQAVVVAAAADGQHVRRSLDAGAVGYLLADVEPDVLVAGVRAVARGESPIDPRAVRAMLQSRPPVRGDDLTAREREVLALVAQGMANKQIARRLAITDGTVKAHIGSIFARIGVADRTSAAVWAERNLRPPVTADSGPGLRAAEVRARPRADGLDAAPGPAERRGRDGRDGQHQPASA